MKKQEESVSKNFTALVSIVIVFSILVTGVLFSNIQEIHKLESYSDKDWSVTKVKEKVIIVNDDDEIKYKLELLTHDKAKYNHLFIDEEFFSDIKDKELVRYKLTGKDKVVIKHF